MYSERCIGARVICSARVKTAETVLPKRGVVTVQPPKRVESTIEVVNPTTVVATLRAIENFSG